MFIKYSKFVCVLITSLMMPMLAMAKVEVRNITPPKLDNAHLGQKILCHRPTRHGAPNMSIEKKNDKVIAHNYGHGGSGWTLGPGSAVYVNNLLLKSKHAGELTKETAVTIIGGGALGLFAAYDLQKRGFKNIRIIAEKFDSLASHNAGGLFAPISMDNNSEIQKIIDKIGIDAYNFYVLIAKKQHPDFKNGAMIVPAYFENREDSGLEPYVGRIMQPAKNVVLDFGNGTKRNMVVYDDGIFIDTATMMNNLHHYLRSKKVKFLHKKINSFSDIDEEFIINCSGLGSAALNNDSKMISVQGHLIMLKDQNKKDLNYMALAYFNKAEKKSRQKVKRCFYIFPKHFSNTAANDVGVIGGTLIEGADSATPNEEEFDVLLQGAKKFYGIK